MLDFDRLQQAAKKSLSKSDEDEATHFGAADIGWQALGPALACMFLATAVVSGRWVARRRIAKCEGLDDYVVSCSLVCFARLRNSYAANPS